MIDDAAPAAADHALAVRVVDHQHDAVRRGNLVDLVQWSDIAVHAEHAVSDCQRAAVFTLVLADDPLQVSRVGVSEADDRRAGEAAAVDDTGMVELVGEDDILFADQRLDGRQVSAEAGLEGDGSLDALESRQAALQLQVQVHGAGDGAHCAWSGAVLIQRLLGGRHHLRMVGQPEVVVRAEVKHALTVHHQPGALRRAERADTVIQSSGFQAFDFFLYPANSIGHVCL